ncbi:MAG: hypothetical protein H7323_12115 [Frankiales bacterium]|nr:hypothetical protein [Frankiales bacterium]
MRWHALFADLEGQLQAADAADLAGEVADRSRREAALVELVDRLLPAVGQELVVHVLGPAMLRGRLLDAGRDWLLLDERGADVLVALAAVTGINGVGNRTRAPDSNAVAARLDLRWALRGLARSRTGVVLGLIDGDQVTGTVDRVGADHLDLAEHGRGEARRAATVRQVRLVPLRSLASVRSD